MKLLSVVPALVLLVFPLYAQRESISLDGEWQFALDPKSAGIAAGWFKAGPPAGESRLIPHTWNVEKGAEEYDGPGWYAKEIIIPAHWKGRSLHLQFDAVYHSCTIWINGSRVGDHRGSGYTQFAIDASHHLVPGRKNTIVLCVDNSFSRSSIPFLRSFDWPKDGGIIRSARILATGRPGIARLHVTAMPDPPGGEGMVRGRIELGLSLLDAGVAEPGRVRFKVRIHEDNFPRGKVILEESHPLKGTGGKAGISIALDSVRLWRVDSPSLYRIETLLLVDGVCTDSIAATFGFRDIRTDGARLLLNGEPVRLMGVEWMPGSSVQRGMAETKEEMADMLAKMRAVNAIFTRFHWQQDESVLDWCDRHGILVQEEIPFWGFGVPLNDTLMTLGRRHLDEMIGAHYNHPSVIMWGVGNELASSQKPIIDSVRALYAYAKRLDRTRLVNYVTNRLSFFEGPDASGVGDILMWNEYQDTWYLNDPAGIGGLLDSIHALYPDKPLVVSEYGLCEPANQGGDERRARDMIYHTAVMESKPYVAGAIYFCLNDYRTHFGEEGSGVLKRRVHGVFDIHGNQKPSAEVLARLSSPVEILNVGWKTEHLFEITVIASGGLPAHTLKGYTLFWSAPGQDFRTRGISFPLPTLKPAQKIQVPLDADLGSRVVVTVTRPTGEVVARREFDVRK